MMCQLCLQNKKVFLQFFDCLEVFYALPQTIDHSKLKGLHVFQARWMFGVLVNADDRRVHVEGVGPAVKTRQATRNVDKSGVARRSEHCQVND